MLLRVVVVLDDVKERKTFDGWRGYFIQQSTDRYYIVYIH